MGLVTDLPALETRLDQATTALLPELRATKRVNAAAMIEVLEVADALEGVLSDQETVSRSLAGKLWFVFTAMLNEAEHAAAPDPILDAAWNYQDRLRKIFGPSF